MSIKRIRPYRNDVDKYQWVEDVCALMNLNTEAASMFWDLLKNLEIHRMIEQQLNDRSRDTFDIIIPPLGTATIRRKDNSWEIIKVSISESFRTTANEALRVNESNLYRETYDKSLVRLKRLLEAYHKSQYTE